MDRLTKTYNDGSFGVADSLPCGENSYDFKELLIQKVGEYECALENGLVLPAPLDGAESFSMNGIWQRIPCRVGDIVYRISQQYHTHKAYIEKTIVERIAIDRDGVYVHCACKPTVKMVFGVRVFKTKEEAEKMLEEMEGSKNG